MKAKLVNKTTNWTRADALKVQVDDPTTTQPTISADFPVMSEEIFIWDTMPLRKLDGTVVSINGWSVIFTLTAEKMPQKYLDAKGNYDIDQDWVDRHSRAKICYWYAKDAKSWQYGGPVMAEGVSPTVREWAGTPILLNSQGEIELYYTAVKPGAVIAKVAGKITTSVTGVTLTGFDQVVPLLTADGVYYQTEAQNSEWNFRDPSPFVDPLDGKLYMLFEGNMAGVRGEHRLGADELGALPPGYEQVGEARYQAGCVGIAVATDAEGNDWQLLPPLISALGVNDQTERPHLVFQNGKYYLFTISHQFTYAEGLSGPDGVYGFVSDSLFGPYQPLNGSGLVLGNPSHQPYQSYSHCVMANGLVTSFIDNIPLPDGGYRIGGTEAPTVEIRLTGQRSFVVKSYDYGYIPAMENVII